MDIKGKHGSLEVAEALTPEQNTGPLEPSSPSSHPLDLLSGDALLAAIRALRWELAEMPVAFRADDLAALERAERRCDVRSHEVLAAPAP